MSRLSKEDAREAEINKIAGCVHAEIIAELRAESAAMGKLMKLALALDRAKRSGSIADIKAAQEEHDSHKSWCIEQFPDAPEAAEKSFGDTIKSLRVANDLLLWQVASSTGITRLYLERIEGGEVVPPEEVVRLLAKVLKTDEEVLLQLWRSSCEQPVNPALPTEPKISQEAEEHKFFWG
jgi:HTH-type transcriptional regulator, competence development regulator